MNTSETARDAWDKIAKEYDRTNTPTQMWVENEGLRRAGVHSGMKFPGRGRRQRCPQYPGRVSACRYWRRTSLPSCSSCSRNVRARRASSVEMFGD